MSLLIFFLFFSVGSLLTTLEPVLWVLGLPWGPSTLARGLQRPGNPPLTRILAGPLWWFQSIAICVDWLLVSVLVLDWVMTNWYDQKPQFFFQHAVHQLTIEALLKLQVLLLGRIERLYSLEKISIVLHSNSNAIGEIKSSFSTIFLAGPVPAMESTPMELLEGVILASRIWHTHQHTQMGWVVWSIFHVLELIVVVYDPYSLQRIPLGYIVLLSSG